MKKITLLTGSLLLLTSWGFPSNAAPVKQDPRSPKPSIVQTVPPKATKANVELINPGAQPRQLLRYKPTVNTKETATMTMDMDMKMSVSGSRVGMPTKLPSTVMKMETIVTRVDPNGDIYYNFRYIDADLKNASSLPPKAVEQIRTQMKKLTGLSGTFVMDNRGNVKSSNYKIPPGVDSITRRMLEQMSQTLQQLSSPLPEAEIGVGAKWRFSEPIQVGGMKLNQTQAYELVSVQNGVATLNATIAQEAKAQRLSQPGMPVGANLTLKSLNSTGQGQTTLRFDRLMPAKATVSVKSLSQMEATNGAKARPITIDSETLVEAILESR